MVYLDDMALCIVKEGTGKRPIYQEGLTNSDWLLQFVMTNDWKPT